MASFTAKAQSNFYAVLADADATETMSQIQPNEPQSTEAADDAAGDDLMTGGLAEAHRQHQAAAATDKYQAALQNDAVGAAPTTGALVEPHHRQQTTAANNDSQAIAEDVARHKLPPSTGQRWSTNSKPRATLIDIYLESEEQLNGEPCKVVELVRATFPLPGLAPASKFVRDQLIGIPLYTYGGDGGIIRELYVPASQVDKKALRMVLGYIGHAHLPFETGFDRIARPQLIFKDDDIKAMCNLYKVYLFLGMRDGQLHNQSGLVNKIKSYFGRDQTIDADEVLTFWHACKEDSVLTWLVMQRVYDGVMQCAVPVQEAFSKYFEKDSELHRYWEALMENKKEDTRRFP